MNNLWEYLEKLYSQSRIIIIKKLAEFVCQTENFSNFILGEHSGKGGIYYFVSYSNLQLLPLFS